MLFKLPYVHNIFSGRAFRFQPYSEWDTKLNQEMASFSREKLLKKWPGWGAVRDENSVSFKRKCPEKKKKNVLCILVFLWCFLGMWNLCGVTHLWYGCSKFSVIDHPLKSGPGLTPTKISGGVGIPASCSCSRFIGGCFLKWWVSPHFTPQNDHFL